MSSLRTDAPTLPNSVLAPLRTLASDSVDDAEEAKDEEEEWLVLLVALPVLLVLAADSVR